MEDTVKDRCAILLTGAPVAAALLIGLAGARPHAQVSVGSTTPRFIVASIKENKIGGGKKPGDAPTPLGTGAVLPPQGTWFRARNATLRTLIRFAHGSDGDLSTPLRLEEFRVVGGPSWIGSNAFDIDANMPDGPRATGDAALMLRALLEERFALKAHREMQEMPVYALVRARGDGKLGDRLRARSETCVPGSEWVSREPLRCGVRFRPGWFFGNGVTMPGFATDLSRIVDRVVVDRTGLAGLFDFDVRYTRGAEAQPSPDVRPKSDADVPSIFTALQEQLGLKLESTRAPMDVLVIDSVQRPSEN
jgi:uncharacterized protein (TIGR03435 family)